MAISKQYISHVLGFLLDAATSEKEGVGLMPIPTYIPGLGKMAILGTVSTDPKGSQTFVPLILLPEPNWFQKNMHLMPEAAVEVGSVGKEDIEQLLGVVQVPKDKIN